MNRTYRATGINLKSMPFGEADRLLTILTREYGLIQAIAMGARKHNSSLAGRSGLFVVNDLLLVKGRSLDKVTQAETLESYPKLGQNLQKLTVSQYLAELCLCQALSDQPQEELFVALNQQLQQLEQAAAGEVLPCFLYAFVQLLSLGGVVPQVDRCCVTGQPLHPDLTDPNWRSGFSVAAGGVVTLAALQQLRDIPQPIPARSRSHAHSSTSPDASSSSRRIAAETKSQRSTAYSSRSPHLNRELEAIELTLLQTLIQALPSSPIEPEPSPLDFAQLATFNELWFSIERLLRQYAQYHFDRPIRSAALMDACFLNSSVSSQSPEP
ncbi:MAG: DNA repair protein RecO [Leptodesmis sp.]|uniref:DNA repair protein RecO n=1 Tax=Leptodesmis sp. TaxID=3100501 RepID=UPI003D0B4844